MGEKAKYTFKCLEQDCDTMACHTRPVINVTLSDISRWTAQNYLQQIINGVTISPTEDGKGLSLQMLRKPLKSDEERTACIFFHEDSGGCEIRYSRPISCRTYPLQYNGEKFYVIDKECPGIGKGEISKEALKEARDLAEQDYTERVDTALTIPGIYSVIVGQMLRQSAESMKDLSDEDRKKIDEIMGKSKESEEPESS